MEDQTGTHLSPVRHLSRPGQILVGSESTHADTEDFGTAVELYRQLVTRLKCPARLQVMSRAAVKVPRTWCLYPFEDSVQELELVFALSSSWIQRADRGSHHKLAAEAYALSWCW
jgi:hypothetical protein